MENIISNFNGTAKRTTFRGKDYLVQPVAMIVEGVLPGSLGPLFYSANELGIQPSKWNGMPIVQNHPSENGKPLSARVPHILSEYQLGIIFNSTVKVEDGKTVLRAEAWFDIEATKRINNSIYQQLTSGNKVEVSTGLTFSLNRTPGVFNGVSYHGAVENIQPDHLAVLTDEKGACSVLDGCGVNNEFSKKGMTTMALTKRKKNSIIKFLVGNCDCWSDDDVELLENMEDEQLIAQESFVKDGLSQQAAFNEATKSWKDEAGNEYVFNSESTQWDMKPIEKAKNKEKETVANSEPKFELTQELILKHLPDNYKEAIQYGMNAQEKDRQKIIGAILKRQPEDRHEALTEVLNKKSLDALQEMEMLLPPVEETPVPAQNNFLGAGSPNRLPIQESVSNTEHLVPLPIDWGKPIV